MEILYFTVFVTLLFTFFFLLIFIINVWSGQMDNIEIEGQRILIDELEFEGKSDEE